MGWPADRVVVMGRSLGSGPAACLAREFQPGVSDRQQQQQQRGSSAAIVMFVVAVATAGIHDTRRHMVNLPSSVALIAVRCCCCSHRMSIYVRVQRGRKRAPCAVPSDPSPCPLCVVCGDFFVVRPQALFLLAPFTGVGDMAESIVGGTLASMFNLNQWDNKVCVSPYLVVHEAICHFGDIRAKLWHTLHESRRPNLAMNRNAIAGCSETRARPLFPRVYKVVQDSFDT